MKSTLSVSVGTVVTLDASAFGSRVGETSVYVTGEYGNFFSVDMAGFEIETKSIPFYRGALDSYDTSFRIGGLTYRMVPVRHTLDKFVIEKGAAKIKHIRKMSYEDFVADRIKEKIAEVEALSR